MTPRSRPCEVAVLTTMLIRLAPNASMASMSPMTMEQAAEPAEKLWSRPDTAFTETIGTVKRRKTSPRFIHKTGKQT